MGEGKTRVILPLLVLALAGSGDVVRMNFLGELLADAAGDFERTLTGAPLRLAWLWQHLELPPLVACIRLRDAQAAAAEVCRMHSCTQALLARAHVLRCAGSLLRVPIFLLPFSRDIQIDEGGVALLERQLQRCVAAGGCLCIAREHRASLLLKQQVRCRCCGCTIVALDTEACVALIELFTPSSCHVQVLSVALRCLRKQLCADCALACRSAQVQQSAQHPTG